jgi:GT2 family glycosyltransferase
MLLSVVVTVVEGSHAVVQCLTALESQINAPDLEIIVPWDDTVAGIPELERRFPRCRFLAMGHVATEALSDHARGQHELFDRRRSAGLASARGDVVAILEDRGIPTSDWAETVARLHRELPHAVIGGSVENGVDRLANRAVYLCDFSRYQRPFEAGPATWVTDVNVTYKRAALEATRELWKHRYHEPVVHGALAARGETLYLTPAFAVFQHRTHTTSGRLLAERLHWGRLFAYTRINQANVLKRVLYLFATPLIPVVMFARIARQQAAKQHLRSFLPASPAVFLLLVVWASGEALGYATARP